MQVRAADKCSPGQFSMNILTINCGSSSLKFLRYEVAADGAARPGAWGNVDRIGAGGVLEFHDAAGRENREAVAVPDHADAARRVLAWLGAAPLTAVAHRVVHGGDRFVQPARIDDAVIAEIDALSALAPLHNLPALAAIRAARAALGEAVPMVAVFDTAFHRTLPAHAARYAIPHELADKYRIQRYGFHGLAHRAMAESYFSLTNQPVAGSKLITLQLGNGCSAAAIADGQSIDTSMGFTPLEGLVMGTRSGDLDPSLAGWLAEREGVPVAQVEDWLNRRAGLLGVSGISRDMRDLLAQAAQGDARAALAVALFCYRVKKYIGAYLAVLGGADAIIFGGGIGEHAAEVRARCCAGLDWCGLTLDAVANRAGRPGCISAPNARIAAYILPPDEAGVLLRDTLACLRAERALPPPPKSL